MYHFPQQSVDTDSQIQFSQMENIYLNNDTDTKVYIKCSHTIVTVLENRGFEINASPAGGGIRIDNQSVHTKEVISRFMLKLNETQGMLVDSKTVLVSAFSFLDGIMTMLYQNQTVKGYDHTVTQRNIENSQALSNNEQMDALDAQIA